MASNLHIPWAVRNQIAVGHRKAEAVHRETADNFAVEVVDTHAEVVDTQAEDVEAGLKLERLKL